MKSCVFVLLCLVIPAFAQQSDSADSRFVKLHQNDSTDTRLDQRIAELQQQITELKEALHAKEEQDELERLLEEAQQLSVVKKDQKEGVGKKFHSGVRQQSGLNPNISLGGDFFAAVSSSKSDYISEPGSFSYGSNRFALREIEVSLNAPLDPFTRGKSFISFSGEGVEIEEAYMEWLNLPMKMNLKVGLFNAEFGALNRYHDHALPQFDRPSVLVHTFGNAPLGGYGMSGNFLMHPMLFSDASSLDLSVLTGGGDVSFTSQGKYNLLYCGHWKNFYDLNQDTYFEWSLSAVTGKNDPAEQQWTTIGDLAFTLKWAPVGRSKYRTLEWKTELLYSNRSTPGGDLEARGLYTSLQNKLNARYWVSARLGYAELPYDPESSTWDVTGCFDVWQSEFVFFRFQYQYSKRDFKLPGPYPDDHSFLFQVCWAMGPHKHEKY